MDFVRLGERYTSNYVPDKLIEGYNSLIWTERFQAQGEFELKTFDIDNMAALLPEDTLVSHLETQEVMQVETHSIDFVGEGEDARPELTIRGRSATSILEHRWVEGAYQKKRRMRKKYSATAAASVLLVNALDNKSGADLTRGDDDPDTEGVVNHYAWNTLDYIPNVAITEIVSAEGPTRWWQLTQGMLYPQLMKILTDADLGLRCLRPVSPSPSTVVTVKTALAERGTVVRTQVADVTQLRFEVYSGTDRTGSVKLSLLQGHIDKPQYLFSKKDYKTGVEIMTGQITLSDVYRPGESGLTGWQRRIMGVDGGSPELPPEPEKPEELGENATAAQRKARREAIDVWKTKHAKWRNKRDRIVADFREEERTAALNALRKARRVNMFSGDVSSLSPYIYKKHYDLGDTVLLADDKGQTAKMMVSEYVRTEDPNGDRGFPGLVEP